MQVKLRRALGRTMENTSGLGSRDDDISGYEMLTWDSELFGFGVARITRSDPSLQELLRFLDTLRQAGVRLVYWPSSRLVPEHESVLGSFDGRMVDLKTTFVTDLHDHASLAPNSSFRVDCYGESTASPDLIALAIQAGEHSRFAVDPKIPRTKFVELYTTWIQKSVARTRAADVLVARSGDDIAGMITVGTTGPRGQIGLVAVDRKWRGRMAGETLIRAALDWFARKGLDAAQVVTQGSNLAAVRLYSKCGFSIERREYYYHFWL